MRIALCLVTLAIGLVLAPTADASYYINKGKAEHYTRDYFHYHVGYHYTVASCRPQGLASPEAGYIYHRWVCTFAVGDSRYEPSCTGQIRISGSGEGGSYYSYVLWHDGKCPLGVSNN